MKSTMTLALVCVAAMGITLGAKDKDGKDKRHCHPVQGKIVWTVIPAPNDPFGRVLGGVFGSLHGSTTDIILQFNPPGPDGVITTVDQPIFMTSTHDILIAEAHATFTPVPGKPDLVRDEQTMTVTGGTGIYEGATGTIAAKGFGHNLFVPPSEAVGNTYFNLDYTGEICLAK